MSALPKPLHDALRAFAPAALTYAEQTAVIERQARKIASLRSDWESLLRLPFKVETMTRAAGRNGPAEYAEVEAHPDDVRDAVDWLIDRHMAELEARVVQLGKDRESCK